MPSTVRDVVSMIYTVRDAASLFKVTDGYIRRLCIENHLGSKKGRDRLLTDADLDSLRKILPDA